MALGKLTWHHCAMWIRTEGWGFYWSLMQYRGHGNEFKDSWSGALAIGLEERKEDSKYKDVTKKHKK